MGTSTRITLLNDRPTVLERFGKGLQKTASFEAVDQQLREVEKAKTEADSKHTEEMKRAGLSDVDVVKPIFQKDASGNFFYKIPGEDFKIQGPYESYRLAATAAREEVEGGPRKTAAYPEFDNEMRRTAEVDDSFPEIPAGTNKKGPESPEINTTEESFFGGPKQVVEQYNENKTSTRRPRRRAAEGDEQSPNKGTTLEGVQKAQIATPESDRSFDGNDGENIQGEHKPVINTKTDSEFGSPKQVGSSTRPKVLGYLGDDPVPEEVFQSLDEMYNRGNTSIQDLRDMVKQQYVVFDDADIDEITKQWWARRKPASQQVG